MGLDDRAVVGMPDCVGTAMEKTFGWSDASMMPKIVSGYTRTRLVRHDCRECR